MATNRNTALFAAPYATTARLLRLSHFLRLKRVVESMSLLSNDANIG
jgi:hypothetical protein